MILGCSNTALAKHLLNKAVSDGLSANQPQLPDFGSTCVLKLDGHGGGTSEDHSSARQETSAGGAPSDVILPRTCRIHEISGHGRATLADTNPHPQLSALF